VSLSWPRALHLAVRPDGAALMVVGGFPRRVVHQAAWGNDAAHAPQASWEPMLETLRKQLVPRYYNARGAWITLSNHFCHYALLPNPVALSRDSEVLAYARHKMRATFGDTSQQWDLRLSKHKDALLVCAVEPAITAALRDLLREFHLPVVSIQPWFATVFNRFRSRIGQDSGWFVVQEPGRLVISRFDDGRWSALASRRTPDDTLEAFVATLGREHRLQESAGHAPHKVWLTSSVQRYVADDFAGSGYSVTVLNPPLPKHANAEDDVSYAMAA